MPVIRQLGFDHFPYSLNAAGMPAEVASAQRQGAVVWIDEVDFRQFEWQDLMFFSGPLKGVSRVTPRGRKR